MAGKIWIPPYKPLGVGTQAVPGGGYLNVDASAGQFGPSPMPQLGLQAAEGAAGIAGVVSEHLAVDNEAIVKGIDTRLGKTEQALLFDPTGGYLNLQGQEALTQASAVIDAYREAQAREMAALTDDDQRQMLQNLTERRLASFSTHVERHGAAERIRWYDEAGERRIAQMQTDARLHWSDDALLRRALGTTRAEVNEQVERHGWDAALTETTLRRQTSRTLVAAIEAAVERDPERARSLHTRYEQHIEASDRAALDALLAEAQTREHARQASAEILNATPPDGEPSVARWRLRQADAIADPAIRAATTRTLHSAAAADEARARTLGEQVLARVLKGGLADPSQIPVREWVALDAERRQAIEARLDHNAAGTEPAPNPTLIDELATQMTQAPHNFARRDLVPAIAHLPLAQWQRFRDWQTGLRRNDPATEDEVYAIKRGFRIARQMLPDASPDRDSYEPSPSATDVLLRAALVEEIDTTRKLTGKSPDDAALREMVRRSLPDASAHNLAFPVDPRTAELGAEVIDELMRFATWVYRHTPALHLPSGRIAPPAPPSLTVPIGPPFIGDPKLHTMFLLMLNAILQSQTNRMERPQSPPAPTPSLHPRQAPTATMPSPVQPGRPIAPQGPTAETVPRSPDGWWIPPGPRASGYPSRIDPRGEEVYYSPRTGRYVVRNFRGGQGFWIEFNSRGELVGVYDVTLNYFTPRDQLSPEQVKEWTRPVPFPADVPLPPIPPTPIPEPRGPSIIFTPIPPPADPTIIWTPIPPPAKPQIMERRVERWDHNEAWEEHHHIPQETYQHGKGRRIPFSPDAVRLFDEQTVRIPKDEHWSDLHGAYNKAARKALMDYLEKNKKPGETWKEFAGRMTRNEAQKCYEYMIDAILNPPKGLKGDEAEIAKDAKEFLENVSLYVPKKKPN